MSKLSKIAQNIFGSQSSADQIAQFGSLAAGSATFTTDPSVAQSLVQWLNGWFSALIDGSAPAVEDMNAFGFVTTYQLAYLIQQGVAEWDSTTEYYIGSIVNSSGVLYVSTQDSNQGNSITNTSFWVPYGTDPVGTGKDYFGASLPGGYVWGNGQTIGNASSNASGRANADTVNLFTLLWNNAQFQLYNSGGTPISRGGSAASDFASNTAIAVPDMRGRVAAGVDDMGGASAANRLTTASITDPDSVGSSGGNELSGLTSIALAGGATNVFAAFGQITIVQPTLICNYIIKL